MRSAPPHPRVTVFTAVDQSRHLDECLASLLAQDYLLWNWVIVLSQGIRWRPHIDDGRVHVLIDDGISGAGALKHLAASGAMGEFLVPLEDSDGFVPDTLTSVVAAFDAAPSAGVVYSDHVWIDDTGSLCEPPLDRSQGWGSRRETFDGQPASVTSSFEASPHNVTHVAYSPGPLRAFRRTTYEESGGYDPALGVFADVDLMCRLYQVAEFVHLPKALYRRRVPKARSAAGLAHEGEATPAHIYDRYIQQTAVAWARRNELLAIDIGRPEDTPPDFLSVGNSVESQQAIRGDIGARLDLPDSSVGVIRAFDAFPRIADKIGLFNEMYRLLAHGGMVLSLTPSTDGRGAFQDPAHVSYFNEASFWYYTNRQYRQFVPQITCRFQIGRLATFFPTEWHEQHRIPYVTANLIALKGGARQGGIIGD